MFNIFQRDHRLFRSTALVAILAFFLNLFAPLAQVQAQGLPTPGTFLSVSTPFTPVMIKGLQINPDNPLQFDFIIDTGDSGLGGDDLHAESTKLIKYFLASLTTKEEEMWVNLSPYEKDRIIPDSFGKTEMGRDLLAQDYLLKQLSASLMYPETELGSQFWDRVFAQAEAKFGTRDIPTNTFNKIWIVPQTANIFEHEKGAFVVSSYLKVMLEDDYLAMSRSEQWTVISEQKNKKVNDLTTKTTEIIREILIPEIEREVNQGKTFANLRQIFNSMILATWYKQNLKASLLGHVYVDQNKTQGVHLEDTTVNQKIYDQYIKAFEKGVYDYIKEDYDPLTQEIIPRKYFSGGFASETLDASVRDGTHTDFAMLQNEYQQGLDFTGKGIIVSAGLDPKGTDAERIQVMATPDAAMVAQEMHRKINILLYNREEIGHELANLLDSLGGSISISFRWGENPRLDVQVNAILELYESFERDIFALDGSQALIDRFETYREETIKHVNQIRLEMTSIDKKIPEKNAKKIVRDLRNLEEFFERVYDIGLKTQIRSLNEYIRPFLSNIEGLKPDNVVVESEFEKEEANILIDDLRMDQVILNIIRNALYAMPNGGTLKIKTLVDQEIDPARAKIEISDTGEGMSSETLESIFDYGFTTKGKEGSGIGLALSKESVEAHGGTIEVESVVGQGTTFTILLPVEDAAMVAVRRASRVINVTTAYQMRRLWDPEDTRKVILNMTEYLGKQNLLVGKFKASFPLPNRKILGDQRSLRLGTNLTKVTVSAAQRNEKGEVLEVVFTGYKKRKGGGEKVTKSYWKLTGDDLEFVRKETVHPVVALYAKDQGIKGPVNITKYFGVTNLRERGTFFKTFPLPNGKTLGDTRSLRLGIGLTKIEVDVVERDEAGEVSKIVFIGHKKKVRGKENIIKSYWKWTRTDLEIDQEVAVNPVTALYERDQGVEGPVNISEYLGFFSLLKGMFKSTFPLPNGKKLGDQRSLRLGINLTKVEVDVVERDKEGEVSEMVLIGYKRKRGGGEKVIKSYWKWTGEDLEFIRKEENVDTDQAMASDGDGADTTNGQNNDVDQKNILALRQAYDEFNADRFDIGNAVKKFKLVGALGDLFIDENGDGIMVLGESGVGKTLFTAEILKRYPEAKFVAEDFMIISILDNRLYAGHDPMMRPMTGLKPNKLDFSSKGSPDKDDDYEFPMERVHNDFVRVKKIVKLSSDDVDVAKIEKSGSDRVTGQIRPYLLKGRFFERYADEVMSNPNLEDVETIDIKLPKNRDKRLVDLDQILDEIMSKESGDAAMMVLSERGRVGEELVEQRPENDAVKSAPGGIDFNPEALDIQTEGQGFEFNRPVNFGDFQNINIDGFSPVILNIRPVLNLPLLLGLADQEQEPFNRVQNDLSNDPMDRKKRYQTSKL